MFTTREILKFVLGILIAVAALYMGRLFWLYFMMSFGTIFTIFIVPIMLGYIYIVIGLARFKVWAWQIFLLIILFTMFMEFLFVVLGGVKEGLLEWFFALLTIIAAVVISVFGISALVRKIVRR